MFAVTMTRGQLIALHRAIHEAKFHRNPEDEDLMDSPLLAEVADAVRDLLRKADVDENGDSALLEWTHLLEITSETPAWRRAQTCASRKWRQKWGSWTEEVRRRAITALLSPYHASAETHERFGRELEEGWRRRAASRGRR